MARLPIPGSDDGTWGDILNAFLTVEHNSDGSLKSSSTLADYALVDSPTFTGHVTVPTPSSAADAVTKAYVDAQVASGAPDADAITKGKVRLAGDLTGTADSPQIATGVIVDADVNASANIAQSKVAGLTTSLGLKAPLASPTFTGTVTVPTPSGATDAATKAYADKFAVVEIPFIIDGGSLAITTGQKGYLEVPFNCTITQASLFADQVGSIVVDIWKTTYSSFPPNGANSITASAKPTLSSAQKSQDATLTGWTTAITAGDILAFNISSASIITRVTVSLKAVRT